MKLLLQFFLVGCIFLGAISWIATLICLINFSRALKDQGSNMVKGLPFNPFYVLFGPYDNERLLFWRRTLLISGGTFVFLVSIVASTIWLAEAISQY